MFGPYYSVHYLVLFPVLQSSRLGKESSMIYLNCLYCHLTFSFQLLFLMVPLVVQQCMILAFPGHTHLPIHIILFNSIFESKLVVP